MKEWVFILAEKDKAALGSIRTLPRLQAARNGYDIWLRGIAASDEVDIKVKQLPLTATFLLNDKDQLFSPGKITPQHAMPVLSWTELSKFITIEAPTSAMPGKTDEKVPVKLIPAKETHNGEAMITTLPVLKQYAETASQARLNAIKFAVASDGEVLITGIPLPAIPGKEYWRNSGLLLPCGYEFELPVIASLMAQNINPSGIYEIVFDAQGQWQKIPKENMVQGSRSAVRLTPIPSLI